MKNTPVYDNTTVLCQSATYVEYENKTVIVQYGHLVLLYYYPTCTKDDGI